MGVGFKAFQQNVDIKTRLTTQEFRTMDVDASTVVTDPENANAPIQGEFLALNDSSQLVRLTSGQTVMSTAANGPYFMNFSVRGDTDTQTLNKLSVFYRFPFDVELHKVYDPSPRNLADDADLTYTPGTPVWVKYFAAADNPITGDTVSPRMLVTCDSTDDATALATARARGSLIGFVIKHDTTNSKLTIRVNGAV